MNPQDLPLADIRLPGEVPLWPPAPGWWILAALVLIGLVVAVIQFRRYKKRRVQRELALKELMQIDLQTYTASTKINEVLKRAALAYLPREEVAALTGSKWKAFLLDNLKKSAVEFEDEWLNFAYSGKVDQSSVYRYHSFAQQWLKTALPIKRREP